MKTLDVHYKDGNILYLYLNNFILDASGRCELKITNSIDEAIKGSSKNKIWKVKLEEFTLEDFEENVIVKNRRVKNN